MSEASNGASLSLQECSATEAAPSSWKSRYSGRGSIVFLRLGFVLLFTVGMTGMGVFAWWMNTTHAHLSVGELAMDLRVALLRQALGQILALFSSTSNMLLALSDVMHSTLLVVDSTDPTFSPATVAASIWPVFHRLPLINFLGFQAAVGQTLIVLVRLPGDLPTPTLLFQNGTSTFYVQSLDERGTSLGPARVAPLTPTDLRQLQWFQASQNSTSEQWMYMITGTAWTGPMLTASVPVFNDQGDFLAIIGISVLLKQLSTFLAGLPLKGGDMFVIGRNGQLVASSHEEALVLNSSPITVLETTDAYIRSAGEAIFNLLNADHAHCRRHPNATGCASADTWLVPPADVEQAGGPLGTHKPLLPDFVAWVRSKVGLIHRVETLGDAGLTYISLDLLELDQDFSVVAVLLLPRDSIMGDIDDASKKTLLVIILVALATAAIGSVLSLTLTHKVKKDVELGQELEVANLQLHEMKHRAEVSNETKSAFLANISHEIRTPMTSILGCVDLLLLDPLLGSARGSVEIIKRASTMLLNILNSLLDLAKIDSGKMELEEDSVDLWGMLSSLVDMYSVNVGKRQIDVILDLDENVPHVVRGDVTRIQQILNNLCGNALKFTLSGHVAVRARALEANSAADRATWAQVQALRRRALVADPGSRNFFGSGSRCRKKHRQRGAQHPLDISMCSDNGVVAAALTDADASPPLPSSPRSRPVFVLPAGVQERHPGESTLGSRACMPFKQEAKVGRWLRQLCTRSLRGNAQEAGAFPMDDAEAEPLSNPSHLWLEFEVDDSGVGIPRSKWEAVFDDFNQADTSTTRKFGGTGLGLSIVRRLVRLMKGDIIIAPKDGPGTLFRFWIRLRRCDCRFHNLPIAESGSMTPSEGSIDTKAATGSFNGTAYRLLSTMTSAADKASPHPSALYLDLSQHMEQLRVRSHRSSENLSEQPGAHSFSKSRFCGMSGCATPECNARPVARRQLSRPVLLCMRPCMARGVAESWVDRMGVPVLVADTLESLFELTPKLRARGGWGMQELRHEGSAITEPGRPSGAYFDDPNSTGDAESSCDARRHPSAEHGRMNGQPELACTCHCKGPDFKGAGSVLRGLDASSNGPVGSPAARQASWPNQNHINSQPNPIRDGDDGVRPVRAHAAADVDQAGAPPLPAASCPMHGGNYARPAPSERATSGRHMGATGFIVVMEEEALMRAAGTMPSAEALICSVAVGLVAMSKQAQAEGGNGGSGGVPWREERGRRFSDVVGLQDDGDDVDVMAVKPAGVAQPLADMETARMQEEEQHAPQNSCQPDSRAAPMSTGVTHAPPVRTSPLLEPEEPPRAATSPRSPPLSLQSGSGVCQEVVELAAQVAGDASSGHSPTRSPQHRTPADSSAVTAPSSRGPAPSDLNGVRFALDLGQGRSDHNTDWRAALQTPANVVAERSALMAAEPPPRMPFKMHEQRRMTCPGSLGAREGRHASHPARMTCLVCGSIGGDAVTVEGSRVTHRRSLSIANCADYVQLSSLLDDVRDRMEEAGVSLVLLASCNGGGGAAADAPFDELELHSAVRRVGTLVYMPLHRLRLQEALQEVELGTSRPNVEALTTLGRLANISPLEGPPDDFDRYDPVLDHDLRVDMKVEAFVGAKAAGGLATVGLPAAATASALSSASALAPTEIVVATDGALAAAMNGEHDHPNKAPGSMAPPEVASSATAAAATKVGAANEEKPLVLLVEDTEINQRIFRKMLQSMGVDVDVASDGVEAVEAWKKKTYDLVLMDCQLPVLDGYQATMAIHLLEAQRGVVRPTPIVALTADAMLTNRRRCEEAGMTSFLTKPISQSSLQRGVMSWSLRKPKKQSLAL